MIKIRRGMNRHELEIAYSAAIEDASLTHMALNSVLCNKVRWFRKGSYKIGLVQLGAAHGGIVIESFTTAGQSPYASAYYWEKYYQQRLSYIPNPNDKEANDLRQCAITAHEWAVKRQNREEVE